MAKERNPLRDPQPGDRVRGRYWVCEVTKRDGKQVHYRAIPDPGIADKPSDEACSLKGWREWCREQRVKVLS